jgi:voltage-gated potassium channel
MEEIRRRMKGASVALALVLLLGTLGYYVLGNGRWDLLDCLYMTLVTVTTLGLEALPGFERTEGARVFTMVLLVMGIGTFLYFVSSLTAMILEGDLQHAFRRKRMQKQIDAMKNHVIVCGVGRTGRKVVQEMLHSRADFVAIDSVEEHVWYGETAPKHERYPYIVGDATNDDVLAAAGVGRARALVAALTDDKDNLYVVITARQANAEMRIVARAIGDRAPDKLRKAGANTVISTNQLGGMRLANEVLRPHVTEFLEESLRSKGIDLLIEEVRIPHGSPLIGLSLAEAKLRNHSGALVLAVRDISTREWHYSPGPDAELKDGTLLIVLVERSGLESLRHGVANGFV